MTVSLEERIRQIEEYYRRLLQYPALTVDEAKTQAGRAGDSEFIYGETPPASLMEMLRAAGLSADDVFYDLGCGLAQTVLVASLVCKQAHGIEYLEPLARIAGEAARALGIDNVRIHNTDYRDADLRDATLFYCYATCTTEPTRALICARLLATVPGTRIVTVTHPLDHPEIERREPFELWWGGGRHSVYLHVRR